MTKFLAAIAMDAVFYLFVVVIGGMVVASITISLIILVVAFVSWGAIRALDVLKGLASTHPEVFDRLKAASYKSIRWRSKGQWRLRSSS